MVDETVHLPWERRQAELWERIFQATHDVVLLVNGLEEGVGEQVVKTELVRCAMAVGCEVVRANAADDRTVFLRHLKEARLKAVEVDYWLRLIYILEQKETAQHDLSALINQYATIIDMLQKFNRHAGSEPEVIARHTKGPRIS